MADDNSSNAEELPEEVNGTDDDELVLRSQQGDVRAFDELVERYHGKIYGLTYNMTSNREDAEDLTQEVFIKAFEALPRFRGNSSFYTWLYRIALNRAFTRRRQQKPADSVEQRHDEGEEFSDPGDRPEKRMQREEQADVIHQALDTLNEEQRTVIVMRELEGFSYETMAEMLDVSVGTIRSRLHRAREQLREALKRRL